MRREGITGSGESGHGAFEVEVVNGMSALTSLEGHSPLKLLAPHPRGQSVWLYSSSFGGGMVSGDSTRLEATIGDGSRCFLGTQASTKIYKTLLGRGCRHQMTARVGAGSLFVLAPDPVQCFSMSDYQQHQRFDIASSAGLVLVDCCQAGRVACGERWDLTRYASRNEVWIDGRLAVMDSILLDPSVGPLDAAHRLGRYNCVGMILVLGEMVRDGARRLLETVAAQPVMKRATWVMSASAVRGGALVRFAAERSEEAATAVREHLRFLAEPLGDDPWARKW